MGHTQRSLLPLAAAFAAGCSAGGTGTLAVGTEGAGGMTAAGPGSGGAPVVVLQDAGRSKGLSAHFESPQGIRVAFVTLSCSNACADVLAVPEGGNAPYTVTWEDGSTRPGRHVCPSTSTQYSVTVDDAGFKSGEFSRPPQVVTAELAANLLACADAGSGAGGSGGTTRDAGVPVDPSRCVMGDPRSPNVAYFAGGGPLPAGHYRVAYTDGCMKYGPPVGWTVHNLFGLNHWALVGDPGSAALGAVPGITGGGVTSFDDCVAQSKLSPPLDVTFQGGKLGVLILDNPLDDNVPGENDRNPTWCFTKLD